MPRPGWVSQEFRGNCVRIGRMGKAVDTKRRIMDAAEALFADNGYDAVSMRDVASNANVLVSQITYHFSTKENVFEEVIARRAVELNRRRRELLRDLRGGSIEDILDVYLRPYLDLVNGKEAGWRAYGRLIAQIGQSQRWQKLSSRYFSDLGHALIDRLIESEPTLSRGLAVHGYVHMVSVMFGVFAASGLIDIFSDGSQHASDIAASYETMIRFCAGGIRTLATSPPPVSIPAPKRLRQRPKAASKRRR